MKTGVSISPCGVVMRPRRAAPSRASTTKRKAIGIDCKCGAAFVFQVWTATFLGFASIDDLVKAQIGLFARRKFLSEVLKIHDRSMNCPRANLLLVISGAHAKDEKAAVDLLQRRVHKDPLTDGRRGAMINMNGGAHRNLAFITIGLLRD